MAEKVYINVPYKDKDLAKKLGAKWDKEKNQWFYYDNDYPDMDFVKGNYLALISKWFPPKIEKVYQKEIKYSRFKTPDEILDYLGIFPSDLFHLSCSDQDFDGSLMLRGKNGANNRFMLDILHESDLNDFEISIFQKKYI